MSKSAYCIATSQTQASQIVDRLKAAGFVNSDIAILFPDKRGAKDFGHAKGTKAPEGAAVGAGTGALLGGTLGWLAGIGTLAIPGVGPFIAAGPIMAALGGVALGGTVGGLTGTLVGLGVPEYEAKLYEGKLREGNILLSVHSDEADRLTRAKTIFKECGAHDIATGGEAKVKANP
jgi:hypothetical protein